METNFNNVASQDIVGALARKNYLSIDSFEEFTETRVALFEVEANKIMQGVKVDYDLLEQSVYNLLNNEKENDTASKLLLAKIEKNRKEIDQINSKICDSGLGMFMRAIYKSLSFWILSLLTVAFMGAWTLIAWVLVRRRVVELTDITGGILKYFSTYSNGVPKLDFLIMIGAGAVWTVLFCSIYISMYNRNKINNVSPHWRRYETLAVISLISFEVIMTVLSAHTASLASQTNKHLSDASRLTIFLESLPLLISWLLWHFIIYKNWIVNIRDKAVKMSGDIPLMELKERKDTLLKQRAELEKTEAKLELERNLLKRGKLNLKSSIVAFKTFNHDIFNKAIVQKNAVIDFGNKWLGTALDELTLNGGQARKHDYEIAINNVVKKVTEAIDKRAKECSRLVELYNEKANSLLKILNPDYAFATNFTNQRLPAIILLCAVLFFGCAKSSILNEKPAVPPINLIVGVDLSNRFLQDNDSLFLPVAHDLSVIDKAFSAWEQNIIASYDQGVDVTLVDGAFSVIPVSLPNESKKNISGLGFCIELSNLPIDKRWEFLPSYKDSIQKKSNLLYETALKYKPFGADIWSFFRDLDLYIKAPRDSITWRNKLILLTDGYPYIEDNLKNQRRSNGFLRDYLDEGDMNKLRGSQNWEEVFESNKMGFIPIGKTYSNLEILVIGINEPSTYQGSATEFSIIERYWTDFFKGMGIVKYRFIKLNSPATENIIHNFLNS